MCVTKLFTLLKFCQSFEMKCLRLAILSKNLKTDYIDLHWPTGAFNSEIVPIAETMSALNQLKQARFAQLAFPILPRSA